MGLKRSEWYIVFFNLAYILAFTTYYVSIQNYEFLWYVLVLVAIGALIISTLRKSNLSVSTLWGLSFWGLFHMAGGGVKVAGDVLYNLKLFPLFVTENFYVLKFDQLVHAYGFAVIVFVAWEVLSKYWNESVNYKVIYPALVAISMGMGALNEIVEFIATLTFPETNVGGYYNTGLDIVFNTIGAIVAVIVLHFKRK